MVAHGWQTYNPHSRRRLRAATGLILGALALALPLAATPAGAVVVRIGGHGYGIAPITGVSLTSMAGAQRTRTPSASRPSGTPRIFDGVPEGGGPLLKNSGPVMHSSTTHVIYWDPNGEFTTTTKEIVNGFFSNVAHDSGQASNVFGIAGQYTDATGNAAYSSTSTVPKTDTEKYPTGGCTAPTGSFADAGPPYTECMLDGQLQSELSRFIAAEKLPVGPTQLYFLLLPHKVATCLEEQEEFEPGVFEQACSNNVFCAYHSVISEGTSKGTVYADIPFSLLDTNAVKGCQDDGNESLLQYPNGDIAGTNVSTRFADVALKYISHEFIEAITDPQLNAWFDANELEIGDKCNGVHGNGSGIGYDANSFLPVLGGSAAEGTLFNQSINAGHYYLQSEWDNAGKACLMKPLAITAAGFTPTAESTIVGATVAFNASVTDPYGHPSLVWDFGDGETGNGSSPHHAYASSGEYTVTMTPRDELTGSTAAPIQHTVIVKSLQTISFTSTVPGSATAGGPTYTAAATATSGLPVSFSSRTPSVCSVAGSAVSFSGAGTCTIDAEQAGNAAFMAAPEVRQSFAVAAAPTHTVASEFEVVSAKPGLTSPAPTPDSTLALLGIPSVNAKTGAFTFRVSVNDPGTLSWVLTFANGKFGVFAVKIAHCKSGRIKLGGRCLPASIVFAKGSRGVSAPGTVTFTVKPSAAGLKALRSARKKSKGLPVTATLTFQASAGGAPVSHVQSLVVNATKLK